MSQYGVAHKLVPMPQAMEIPDAKAAADKEWDKMTTSPAWQESKVKSKQEVVDHAQKEGKSVNSCHDHGLVPPKKSELIQKFTKKRRPCCGSGILGMHAALM